MCLCARAYAHVYVWTLAYVYVRACVCVSVSAQDGIVALGKGPQALRPRLSAVSPRLPSKQWQCLLFPTSEGGMSAASFLHSSSLQVINAVMLWSVHVQKVPQATEHLCPAKLQTRCDSLLVHFHWLRHAQGSRSTQVFATEDSAWLCGSRGSPFRTPPTAAGSSSPRECAYVRVRVCVKRKHKDRHAVWQAGRRLDIQKSWTEKDKESERERERERERGWTEREREEWEGGRQTEKYRERERERERERQKRARS